MSTKEKVIYTEKEIEILTPSGSFYISRNPGGLSDLFFFRSENLISKEITEQIYYEIEEGIY
jgi:hypothetical protein